MDVRRPGRSKQVAAVLIVGAIVLLAACDDGRRVTAVQESEPDEAGEAGVRSYRVAASDGSLTPGGDFEYTGQPGDDWVRHCFDRAEIGGSLPFYCSAGRTRTEVTTASLLAIASIGAVWLLTGALGMRVPAPAPVAPAKPDDWLFARTEVEKQAHRPVWREHWRMAATGYAVRAGLASIGVVMAGALLAGWIGPAWLREWFVGAGAANFLAFALFYGWRSYTRDHLDEVTHARLTCAIGTGLGLLLAGAVLLAVG